MAMKMERLWHYGKKKMINFAQIIKKRIYNIK